MAIGWSFPSNSDSSVIGIGEAGIETFKGAPYRSLAREICQNSLDAQDGSGQPVVVEFRKVEIPTKDIAYLSELQEALYACRRYWTKYEDKKTKDFFNKAIAVSESGTIPVLRVSDFHTTGLIGADSVGDIEEMDIKAPWVKLVKGAGISGKEGASGGSFGIGKSAAYACSDMRTVYYSTIDIHGVRATQGVARLVSFPQTEGKRKQLTAGMGYFGKKEMNQPIYEWQSLDKQFIRKTPGTDVFILGFTEKKDWKQEMIASVLEDFLMAVYAGRLEVCIEEERISRETLQAMIETYKEIAPNAYHYYLTLTSEDAVCETIPFNHLGKIELHLLFKNGLHRRVLMCRNNGIRVYDQKNISATIQFAGICMLKDEKLSEYFRGMENPQHNAWEPERHERPGEAKKIKQDLTRLIKKTVLEFGKKTTAEEMDAEGVGEYLPDDISSIPDEEQKRETLTEKIKDMQMAETEKHEDPAVGFEYTLSGNEIEPFESKGSEAEELLGGGGSKDRGDDEANQRHDGTGFGGGEGDGSGTNGDGANPYSAGDEHGEEKTHRKFTVRTMAVRLFLVDKKAQRYQLTFTPKQSAEGGYLQLRMMGEQNGVDVNILQATNMKNGKALDCRENRIRLKKITKNVKQTVQFTIDYSESASMEVALYGYKG